MSHSNSAHTTERLQVAQESLPPDMSSPVLAPMSSIMGEILFLGLTGDEGTDPMDVRDYAEWELRRRLLAIPGIAQVTPIGGELRQVQVVLEPAAMERLGIGHRQVIDALEGANANAPGGFLTSGHSEYLIRGIGRAETVRLTPAAIAPPASGRRTDSGKSRRVKPRRKSRGAR